MNRKFGILRLIAVVAVAGFAAACSDGELALEPGAGLSSGAPEIVQFEAVPLEGDAETTPEGFLQVERGKGIKLIWNVLNAENNEITSSDGTFHVASTEATGEAIVEEMTATTDFTLVASGTVTEPDQSADLPEEAGEAGDEDVKGEDEAKSIAVKKDASGVEVGPNPSEDLFPQPDIIEVTATDEATITVVVIEPRTTSASITAEPQSVNAGDTTNVCWVVTPPEAETVVTASTGEILYDSVAAASAPESNCAEATPYTTTTYQVTASYGGNAASDVVTVEVTGVAIDATIMADGREGVVNITNAGSITISYEVIPADASATVVADNQVSCQPALPSGEVLEGGRGESVCNITESTRFTLTATKGELEAESSVSVLIMPAVSVGDYEFQADPWAFEGEEVEITMKLEGVDRSVLKEVELAGAKYPIPASGNLVQTVTVPAGGVDAKIISSGDASRTYPQVVTAINPIALSAILSPNIDEFSKIVLDETNPSVAYIGVKKNGYNGGLVQTFKIDTKDMSVAYDWQISIDSGLKGIADYQGAWNTNFFEMVSDWPVSAIALDAVNELVCVGTTGALMCSDNVFLNPEAPSWKDVMVFPRWNAQDFETCGGDIQPGNGAAIGSFGRVCDLIAKGDRLLIATDRGVLTITNIKEFIDIESHRGDPSGAIRDSAALVAGRPPAGTEGPFSEPEYMTYTAVAHDLEEYEGTVYAASNYGLFSTKDLGDTWQKEGIEGKKVYSVVVDKIGGKIYAATEDSIMTRQVSGGQWESTPTSGIVYSMAADPMRPGLVLAATSEGLKITRDAGKTWKTASSGEQSIRTVALAAVETGGKVNYAISFGGKIGAMIDNFVVNSFVAPATTSEPEEPTTSEETPEEEPATGGATEN